MTTILRKTEAKGASSLEGARKEIDKRRVKEEEEEEVDYIISDDLLLLNKTLEAKLLEQWEAVECIALER